MESVTINNKKYYNVKDLMTSHGAPTKIKRSPRLFIEYAGVPNNRFVIVRKIKGEWIIQDKKSPPKSYSVMVRITWTKDWIKAGAKTQHIKKSKSKITTVVPMAPPLIELTENERLVMSDGLTNTVEVRGDRSEDKCYFKADDIGKLFGTVKIKDTLNRKNDSYIEGKHYVKFKDGAETFRPTQKITTCNYMTYEGVIKYAYSSYSDKAEKFRKWATHTLFTTHMGTQEKKNELATKLTGVSFNDAKAMLATTKHVSCNYFISLGTVKDLRETFSLDDKYTDEQIVCKFGMTNDLHRRLSEHQNDYGKLKNVNIQLMHFTYISPDNNAEAENYFKSIMIDNDWMVECKGDDDIVRKEMVIIENTKMHLNQIKMIHSALESDFGTKELREIKRVYEVQIMKLEHERDMALLKLDKANVVIEKTDIIMKSHIETNKLKDRLLAMYDNMTSIKKKS